ncbi:hypothetical protein [Carboxylicivirga sp. M1479]|uniref:hypothetical protein n=1 Tax=Carboxylicivirga sp. M1479 TaxID=2594476 RepID=UPI001177E4DB|nr:hypothetical protein [Carboxylicivirga sp. M1479]TRX66321.1 hypothetical protein FNN09_14025 [Carboxylicivirga sp. M1479]
MKYFIPLLLAVFLITACNDDDDYDEHDYHLEYIATASVDLPDEFIYGNYYKIKGTIELPNTCYFYYNQYDYFYEGTTRLIYPIAHVDDGVSCDDEVSIAEFVIPVHALQQETYIFKFYTGEDESGEDTFLTLEVPVVIN